MVDPIEMRTAFLDSPLNREMLEIVESEAPLESSAKRHHFIPRFLLREFSVEANGKHLLHQLDLSSGKPQRVTVEAAASRHRFYAVQDDDRTTSNRVEAYLSIVENHAAPAVRRFLEAPEALSPVDAGTISQHLALLMTRTPVATQRMAKAADTAMRLFMSNAFVDPETFAKTYRQMPGNENAAASEAEEMRQRLLKGLKDGSIGFSDEKAVGLHYGFLATGDTAQYIFQMPWVLLRAEEGEFITSDCGVAMVDPNPRYPWTGNTLLSSPTAQTTIPLSADACLLLLATQPTGTRRARAAPRELVDEVNLGTYGWASRHIFGRTQEAVTHVRHLARRYPRRVPKPRPFRQVLLVDIDPDDDRLARAHAARGWPKYMTVRGISHDYVVLDDDNNPVEQSIDFHELTKRRAIKRLGTSEIDGELLPVDPREVGI
jgi:hypothetical protein